MPTTLTRELTIAYGSFSVGGSTARLLDGVTFLEESFESASVEYTFVITGSTEALFQDEIVATEAAFRTPRQNLTITLGSETLKGYSHASNTGFDANPRITKRGDVADTSRSRRYTVRIEFGLPADNISTSGRRSSQVNVSYSPARRRTVRVTGTYTALSGNSARAQYEAAIAAYTTSVLDALGGTYKLAEEPITEANDTNKIIEFERVFEEIIFTGIGSSDANLRREALRISRRIEAPGDTPIAERLVTLQIEYEAWFDNTATTDLVSEWETLRDSIIEHARTTLGGGSIAIVDENPQFDRVENKISASLTVLGSTRSGVVEYKQTIEDSIVTGQVLVPVWSGNAFAKFLYQGPGTYQRTVTKTYRAFTGSKEPDLFRAPAPKRGNMKSILLSEKTTESPLRLGINGFEFDLVEASRIEIHEFYEEPSAALVTTP